MLSNGKQFLKDLFCCCRSVFDNILNIQLYVTSAPSGDSHDGLSLALALELLYKKSRRDVMTGLKTQCRPGRPDWHTVLADIQKSSSYQVRDVLMLIVVFLIPQRFLFSTVEPLKLQKSYSQFVIN